MAGHSKFKNIMHRKGAQDAKRSKLFSKLSKEITIAAKMGDPDPDKNPRLRLAVNTARGQSMPKDNIERAIKKAMGGEGDEYEEIRYEGYGPGGVAVIIEAMTDNRNRTAGEVRSAFTKNGGNLGESGSVAFMFDQVGQITYKLDAGDAETVFEAALEAGAEECETGEEEHEIICAADALHEVLKGLEDALGEPATAKLTFRPTTTTPVDEATATTLLKLIDVLEDNDDVQNVYANFDIDDETMEKLSAA